MRESCLEFAKGTISAFERPEVKNRSPEFLNEAQGHIDEQRGMWEKKSLAEQLDYVDKGLDFVIVGLPGGATTFVSNLLTLCGTRTGHEAVFHSTGKLKWEQIWASNIKGECSGFAYPYRKLLPQAFQAVTQVYSNNYNTFRIENVLDLVQKITKWPRASIISKLDTMGKGDKNYRGTPIKLTEDDLPRAVRELREFWGYE